MQQTPPTPADIARSPEWLAHRYGPQRDTIQFAWVDRAMRRAATVLTDAHLPPCTPVVPLSRKAVLAAAPGEAPLHFIVHSGFCGSTRLADAFDRPGLATSLKEPAILDDVVGFRHRGGSRADAEALLDGALTLLARPFAAGEAVIVAPSAIVNGFARAALTLRPKATALLLHAPLPLFLGSVAEAGLRGRLWVRQLFLGLATDGLLPFGYGQDEYFGQSDLQIAASCWLAQQALFADMRRRFGARVQTLDSESIIRHPAAVVRGLGDLFGLNLAADMIDGIVAGPAFTRHAAFEDAAGPAEVKDARVLHADELGKVAIWAKAVADAHGIAMTLPGDLLA